MGTWGDGDTGSMGGWAAKGTAILMGARMLLLDFYGVDPNCWP